MGDQKQQCGLSVAAVSAALSKLKPYMFMITLQFGFAVIIIVNLICLKRGLSNYVLVVYRNVVATVAVAPLALVFERKIRPKMTLSVFIKIMALALIEPVIDLNLCYMGMKYTSATFATAMINILPAITFIMAVLFRLEKVKLSSIRSQAKIFGTVLALGGATIMTFYKGPIIEMMSSRTALHAATPTSSITAQNWIAGPIMLLGSCVAWASFFILQSVTLKEYPVELSLTTLIVFFGMLQGAAVALVVERDFSAWAIGFDSRLLAPVCSGIIGSAFAYYVQGAVLKERGPVFVTAFSPLCMIITAALGSLILSEQMHLGSIIGAIVVVGGLYSVIWGTSKDHEAPPIGTNEKNSSTDFPVATTNATGGNTGIAVIDIWSTNGEIINNEVPANVHGSQRQ